MFLSKISIVQKEGYYEDIDLNSPFNKPYSRGSPRTLKIQKNLVMA